jgi:hypothetical protein
MEYIGGKFTREVRNGDSCGGVFRELGLLSIGFGKILILQDFQHLF